MKTVQRKKCKRCNKFRPVTDFHKDKSVKDGLRIYCKNCVKVYDDERQEERNRRARETYIADPSSKIKKTRQYHLDNPDWSRDRLRAHHVAHREERYERYIERGNDLDVRKKRREATRRSESRRRALKLNSAVEVISNEQFDQRFEEFNGECYICGTGLTTNLHWDHYQPLTRGGEHTIANLFPSCDLCNVRKSNCWPFTEVRKSQIREEVLALRASKICPHR
jgi:hypothetical protein